MKYIVLSFDDNTVHDREIVEILNKYNLKGTFFINSGTLNKRGYIMEDELKSLYQGHEIGSHSLNHPRLKELTKADIKYQIEKDIRNLESFSKKKIEGFAYPFGGYSKKVIKVVKELGLKYARTSEGTIKFNKPEDFYEWHPTMHFSGIAWDSQDRERRNRGVKFMLDHVEKFLDDPYDGVMHIWLHSWEFKSDRFKWDQFDRLCRIISLEDELVNVTAIEYYNEVN